MRFIRDIIMMILIELNYRYYNMKTEPWKSDYFEISCYDKAYWKIITNKINKPIECKICLEPYFDEPQIILSCGHKFCKKCLNEWVDYRTINNLDNNWMDTKCALCIIDNKESRYRKHRESFPFKYNKNLGFFSLSCYSIKYALINYLLLFFYSYFGYNRIDNHYMAKTISFYHYDD